MVASFLCNRDEIAMKEEKKVRTNLEDWYLVRVAVSSVGFLNGASQDNSHSEW